MQTLTRVVTVLAQLFGLSAAFTAQPVWACGCGAIITNTPVTVHEETSIVRYDAATRTEDIVMRLSAESAAKDAAWLFPTPSKAQVTLGERGWYEELDKLTDPRVVTRRSWFPGLGRDDRQTGAAPPSAGRGEVEVLGERDLGPFRVATLKAGDRGALTDWLSANGYRLSPKLEKELGPYVDQGWQYVAVKLRPPTDPANSKPALDGTLTPLRVSFATDELVYPMRLSRLAKNHQRLHLYVLGENRVTQTSGSSMQVDFAGRVAPGQVRSPGLRTFLGGELFLTELVAPRIDPSDIKDDYRFTATENVPFRRVEYEERVVRLLGLPAGWLIVFGAGGLLALLFTSLLVKRRPQKTPT